MRSAREMRSAELVRNAEMGVRLGRGLMSCGEWGFLIYLVEGGRGRSELAGGVEQGGSGREMRSAELVRNAEMGVRLGRGLMSCGEWGFLIYLVEGDRGRIELAGSVEQGGDDEEGCL